MVQWSQAELDVIQGKWAALDPEKFGGKALARMFVVYPWTKRYFGKFGGRFKASDPVVMEHGAKVMGKMQVAAKDPEMIKEIFEYLSKRHSDTIHVDPENFKLLGSCMLVEMAMTKGDWSPEIEAINRKFVDVSIAALSRKYH
uniref:Adult beta-type globin n=1 Tax=Callorhinchus milii TaxID=7868 RepID=K4G8X0_CALMI|nr:adult beta-type globin [Callorhinchus milii]